MKSSIGVLDRFLFPSGGIYFRQRGLVAQTRSQCKWSLEDEQLGAFNSIISAVNSSQAVRTVRPCIVYKATTTWDGMFVQMMLGPKILVISRPSYSTTMLSDGYRHIAWSVLPKKI